MNGRKFLKRFFLAKHSSMKVYGILLTVNPFCKFLLQGQRRCRHISTVKVFVVRNNAARLYEFPTSPAALNLRHISFVVVSYIRRTFSGVTKFTNVPIGTSHSWYRTQKCFSCINLRFRWIDSKTFKNPFQFNSVRFGSRR